MKSKLEEIEKFLYYSNIRKKSKKYFIKTLDNAKYLLYYDVVLSDKGQKKESPNPRKVNAILEIFARCKS